jgi:hypothetical protein
MAEVDLLLPSWHLFAQSDACQSAEDRRGGGGGGGFLVVLKRRICKKGKRGDWISKTALWLSWEGRDDVMWCEMLYCATVVAISALKLWSNCTHFPWMWSNILGQCQSEVVLQKATRMQLCRGVRRLGGMRRAGAWVREKNGRASHNLVFSSTSRKQENDANYSSTRSSCLYRSTLEKSAHIN